MKILFVTESLPYPLDRGGYIRSSHLIRELSRRHEVTLLTSQEATETNQGVEYYSRFCRQVICLSKPKPSALKRSFYLLGGLLGETPYPLNKNFSTSFLERIKQELQNGDYQTLHCDHLDTAQYLPLLPNPPHSVFDSHNLLSVLVERLQQQEKSPMKRAYLRLQLGKIRTYEARLSARFDLCLVCSEQEKEHLQELSPQAKVTVIPNGVDLNYYQLEPAPPQDPSLLFIGRLDYLPNSQGVLDFYRRVWPLVRKELPLVRWQIVGANPPSSFQELANDDAIQLVTQADDIRPYLTNSTLAIVPLRVGGGTRIKILEAMAARLPVVSTSVGAEGIGAADGREIVIADEPEDMAEQIITLCQQPERRRQMAQLARQFVTQYDWHLIGKRLLLCYNDFFQPYYD